MDIFKKIIFRILGLSIILLIANSIYTKTLWKTDVLKYADLLDSIAVKHDNTDILYLSSSSNYFHHSSDTSKATISEYINLHFPDLKVNSIHKGYMHLGVFKTILENIPDNSSIKTIVISLNLRSFGAFWVYSDVESNYSSQQLMMNSNYPPLLRRFLLSLNHYDNKSKKERERQYLNAWKLDTFKTLKTDFPYKNVIQWDKAIANSNTFLYNNGSKDYEKITFAGNIVKAFAFEIDESHPRLEDLKKIIDLSEKREWNLIFHILPEDIEKANKMVGPEIAHFLENVKNKVIQEIETEDIVIVDNLNILGSNYFFEKYPTEHYTSVGKMKIAKEVSKKIKDIYPNKFRKIAWEVPKSDIPLHMIFNKKELIKNDSIWFNAIKEKAKLYETDIDKILETDAIWAINEDKKKDADSKSIIEIIKRIQADSVWNNSISQKAIQNNISYEEQLQNDAEWVLKNN